MCEANEECRLEGNSGGAVLPVGTERTWTGDLGFLWVSPDLEVLGLLALQQQAGSQGQRGGLGAESIVTLQGNTGPLSAIALSTGEGRWTQPAEFRTDC